MRKQHVRWAASETSRGNALWGRRWSQWAGLALAWALSVAWSGDARAGFLVSNIGNFSNGTVSQVGDGGGAATPFATGFSNPFGLALDAAGNLYVSNQGNNTVSIVGPGGGAATTVRHRVQQPVRPGVRRRRQPLHRQLQHQLGAQVGPGGGVATTFATGFSAPQGLVFDSAGNLYAANALDGTVSKVGPGGGVATTFATGFSQPVRPGDRRRRQPLRPRRHFHGGQGRGPGGGVATTFATGFSAPDGLTFDGAGNLYVVNAGDTTVKMVGPGGGVATTFATGFNAPRAIVFVPTAAVPEPTSVTLMGIGIVVAMGAAWRRSPGGPRCRAMTGGGGLRRRWHPTIGTGPELRSDAVPSPPAGGSVVISEPGRID